MIDFIRKTILPYFAQFDTDLIRGDCKITPLGNGLINHTYLVQGNHNALVLQKINTQVFTQPHALINNSNIIASHLNEQRHQGKYKLQVVTPITTRDNSLSIDLKCMGVWRALSYQPDSHSIDVISSTQQAYLAAKSFGDFTQALTSLDAGKLVDVIPSFHHLPHRIEQLQQAVKNDHHDRLCRCSDWVEYALSQGELLNEIESISSNLPLRVCHNDTKINNILFDQSEINSLAIVDLDTCMGGHLMYDFGDMVRTFCSPEPEDSEDLTLVSIREPIFEAICKGYLEALTGTLTPEERVSLWLGARVLPLMVGIRFLTDHLNGDNYFKIKKIDHNLIRAANQLTLYQHLITQAPQLTRYLI